MATLPVHKIDLDEEIEGNIIEINDLFFHKIGEGVPVTSSDFQFDDKFLPFQLLACSERFQIIFVANYRGFLVARTKDVIESAKKLKNKENGLSIEEICVISVTIGNVNILALSAESSLISVAVGADVHIYEVNSLLNKDQKSCFFYSFKSSSVKDIQWSKKFEKSYIVLLENGMLYHGTFSGPPQLVLRDVDAVAWDMRGDFIAVAKMSVVSILSSKFIEKLSMSLAMKSWTGKSDVNCVKVDSIRWVRPDCIILGCFEMSGHRKEANYVVQVLTCKHGEITDGLSRPLVLSFADVFPAFANDIVPSESKSCLFLSYLEQRELAILANRRNTDQHILLMGWSQCDGSNDAAVLDIGRDNLRPWIELKENGDDNMVVGLCIDSTSVYEEVKVCLGVEEPKLLSPFCILICLTLDAKIIMFHVSSSSTKDVPVFSRPLAAASLEVCEEHNDLTSQKGEVSDHPSQKPDEKFFESKKSASAHSDNPVSVIKFTPDIKFDRESVDGGKQDFFQYTQKKEILEGQPVKNYLKSSMISGHVGISGSTGIHSGNDISGVAVQNSSYTKSNSVEPHKHIEAENMFIKSYSSNELPSNECRSELNVKITSSSGPKLSKKFGNIREITRELDSLLDDIEGPGGFKDACTVKQNDFLITLERDIETIFEQCKNWKGTLDDQQGTIQHLFEQTTQAMARKTYIEGIVKQVKDNQYWDLWGTQKLSSELDMKQQHILEIKHNMTSQLTKLEKHLNSLELNKFGVPVRAIKENRGAFYPTRSMQSYHSLHKVMSSQLEAAENHSECLSKQMTMLGIGNSEKKRKEKKDLFESIGISFESDLFSTPDSKNNADTRSLHKLTPSPGSVAYGSMSRQANSRHDSESTRRRRDSLDQSWASFEPPTTTLKRVAALKAVTQGSSEEQPSVTTKTDHPVSTISKQIAISPSPARFKRDAENKENPSTPLFISPPLHSSTGSNPFSEKSKPQSKQHIPLPRKESGTNYSLVHTEPRPPPPVRDPPPVFLRPKSPDTRSAPQAVNRPGSVPLPPPVSRSEPGSPREDGQPPNKKTGLNVDPPEAPPLTIRPFTVAKTEGSDDDVFSSEDEMEEEAPEMDPVLPSTLKTLDGLGLGSVPGSVPKVSNPFGGSFPQTNAPPPGFPLQMTTPVPSGDLFRPASFCVVQPPPLLGFSPLAGAPPAGGGGFGRPASIGVGQQALGSVLGSFGQSRELGGGFSAASQSGFGNSFSSAGGGFAGVGSAGGGFSGIASGVAGFGAFGNQAGMGGFSSFGSSSGTVRPASDLFTQMRK